MTSLAHQTLVYPWMAEVWCRQLCLPIGSPQGAKAQDTRSEPFTKMMSRD